LRYTLAVAMCPPEEILELAVAAEAAGWDSIAVPDAVFYPEQVSANYPYTPDGSRFWSAEDPFVDPWVAIPAMAAVTDRIDFYTNVLKAPLREPLLVAKTVSSAAAMFPGRIALGVGLSWIPEEFEWLHTAMSTRGARLDEIIDIVRLTTDAKEMVEHHGKHYDFGPLQMAPVAPEPIPIYVGGHSDAAIERAARAGDGWISAMASTEELRGYITALHERLTARGRGIEGFRVMATPFAMPDRAAYDDLENIGVTDVITVPWYFYGDDPATLAGKVNSINTFAEQIIDR